MVLVHPYYLMSKSTRISHKLILVDFKALTWTLAPPMPIIGQTPQLLDWNEI